MSKKYALLGLAIFVALAVACDEPATEADDEADSEVEESAQVDEPQEEADEPDEASEEAELPPANETETPDDEAIGELPEGVGIATGESAPDVAATDADGQDVDILELVDDEAIVVFFYRGGWCPYCNFQVREMTEAADDFAERGVRPVAISVDQPDKAAETQAGYDIPYPVLSDPDLTVHEAFDVAYQAEEEEVEQLAEHGMDIEEASGRDHNTYAIPSVFVIDSDGEVRWAHANRDYSIRPSPDQLLSVVDELFE